MKRDLLLTYVSGKGYAEREDTRVFWKSAHQALSEETVDKVAIYRKEDCSWEHFVEKVGRPFGFTVITERTKGRNPLRDRWLAYYNLLHCSNRIHDNVCICDARDVLIQLNPFHMIPGSKRGDFLMVFGEGMTHRESEWNLIDQFKYQMRFEEYQEDFKEWDVYNPGVIIGSPNRVKQLCFTMFQAMLGRDDCSDQAAFNYLLNGPMKHWFEVDRVMPQTSWACLTGEGVSKGHVKPTLRDNMIENPKSDGPYRIFHQWDRTEYKQFILNKYKD